MKELNCDHFEEDSMLVTEYDDDAVSLEIICRDEGVITNSAEVRFDQDSARDLAETLLRWAEEGYVE